MWTDQFLPGIFPLIGVGRGPRHRPVLSERRAGPRLQVTLRLVLCLRPSQPPQFRPGPPAPSPLPLLVLLSPVLTHPVPGLSSGVFFLMAAQRDGNGKLGLVEFNILWNRIRNYLVGGPCWQHPPLLCSLSHGGRPGSGSQTSCMD